MDELTAIAVARLMVLIVGSLIACWLVSRMNSEEV
jgi:hypothetical protein